MAIHEHGTPSVIADVGDDGHCDICRPDAAAPKERCANRSPAGVVAGQQCGLERDHRGSCCWTGEFSLKELTPDAPPSSDAAQPVADGGSPWPYVLTNLLPERMLAAMKREYQHEWQSFLDAVAQAHPEDAPEGPTVEQIAKILCPGYNHAQRGLRTPAETKPDLPCRRCLVWAEGIREAFNRLKGDKTDG